MNNRQHSGSAGSPIQLRTTRQAEESARYRQPTTNKRPAISNDEGDGRKVEKPHTSAIRYDRPVPPRRTATLDDHIPKKTKRIAQRRRLDRTSLVMLGCLLFIVMVGGWWLFSTLTAWWTNWQDDLHYGNPRTFQVDHFVDQGDSPDHPDHFIVVNAHGRVIVVQLNLQHPELDHTYGITTADPKTPVSLTFRPTGTTVAMYVILGDTTPYSVELVSNGKQFVSPH
jgi:hypothetical protein